LQAFPTFPAWSAKFFPNRFDFDEALRWPTSEAPLLSLQHEGSAPAVMPLIDDFMTPHWRKTP
jgi:hypothetical protein